MAGESVDMIEYLNAAFRAMEDYRVRDEMMYNRWLCGEKGMALEVLPGLLLMNSEDGWLRWVKTSGL